MGLNGFHHLLLARADEQIPIRTGKGYVHKFGACRNLQGVVGGSAFLLTLQRWAGSAATHIGYQSFNCFFQPWSIIGFEHNHPRNVWPYGAIHRNGELAAEFA